MTITKLVLLLVCLMSLAVEPKGIPVDAKVTPVFSKDLADIPGKEGVMLFIEYPRAVRTLSIATTRMGSFMCWKARS